MASRDEFTLTVMNEKGVLYFGPCKLLFLPSSKGEIAVMKNHTPMIMKLSKGPIHMDGSAGKQVITEAESGIAYVAEDEVSVLMGF